jgi:hypothetical protein
LTARGHEDTEGLSRAQFRNARTHALSKTPYLVCNGIQVGHVQNRVDFINISVYSFGTNILCISEMNYDREALHLNYKKNIPTFVSNLRNLAKPSPSRDPNTDELEL